MRRFVTRHAAVGAVACLVGGMLAVVASATPASAAKALTTPTWSLAHADIFDTGYNQSNTSVITVTDTNGGITIPTIVQAGTSPGTGFTCGAPMTLTATTASCTIEAAPGEGDDSGVVGANGTTNTVELQEVDSSSTYMVNETMIIYPAPACGASGVNPFTGVAGTAGAQISPLDATYSSPLGSPTVAESCYDGASGPPSALLTNVSPSGGTIFLGSNATDAAGGTALTIMAGPGFNWTGGVGSGQADVDTGTAGLSKQVWDTATVTLVTVTGGSNTVSTTATSVPSIFPSTVGVSGISVSGTDIPTGTTVSSGAGTSTLTLSQNATATPTGPETLTFTWASTAASPPSGLLTSASTVATEVAFKSSGDPTNTCPPQQALIDAGMPFCLEEFETTGSGPSATQVALEYAGQNVPTSQAPTVALSSGSGSIGQTITATDSPGGCPEFVGAVGSNPVPASGLFSGTNSCWYGRAGDATPVSVTVGGKPATVTPTPNSTTITNLNIGPTVADPNNALSVVTITGSSVPATLPTNLTGDLVSGQNIPPGTTVTGQGNGTTGYFATVELTLSQPATAASTGETLTFTNNADVSEADYSVGATAPCSTITSEAADCTVTLADVASGNTTVTTSATSAGTADSGTGFPASLSGDTVSGTDIPVGTQVVSVNATGSNSTSTLTLSNAPTATPAAETLTFYSAVLADPQLNASFKIPAGTPTGPQTVDVCEATTPNNGNDWQFGVQWMSPTGSLQYVSGNSGPTEICATRTIDVSLASSSTRTTPASSGVVLGSSNTDSATVTGSVAGIDPTATVNFYECGPTAGPTTCTSGSWTQFDTESLSGSANPDTVTSASFTPTSTGYW
ncbi:MAG: beta strand repeat-containing protein, partial [Acidimicrobiales bacterium]